MQDEYSGDLGAGAGFDVYLSESVALFSEAIYARPTKDASEFDLVIVGAGLIYRW